MGKGQCRAHSTRRCCAETRWRGASNTSAWAGKSLAGPEWPPEYAGGLTRAEGQDRIDFLAQVRNAALEPLWREAGHNGSAWGAEGGFKADRIVFINDVYFCARDVVSPQYCNVVASLPSLAPDSSEEPSSHISGCMSAWMQTRLLKQRETLGVTRTQHGGKG